MSDKNEKSPISADVVRELAEILRETELTEIEVERGDLRLRVARELTAAPVAMPVQAAAAPVAAAPAPAAAPAAPETPAPTDASDLSAHPGVLPSPMVGTAYRQSSPDADPFANVGDMVKEGDTVLLIEAMKTFNPIVAHKSGKIAEILVEDGQPVEFGEPLFIIV
jgi:acetyl-CoA carboxylase biotin carboxyl carrier protein